NDVEGGLGERWPDSARSGNAEDNRPEPVSIHAQDEARQHPLCAPGLKAGNQVGNREHEQSEKMETASFGSNGPTQISPFLRSSVIGYLTRSRSTSNIA